VSPTANSLVLDLLSTLPSRRSVPVGALVRAASILGIGENSLRVALARLRGRGLVESDERGLYRIGAAAQAVNRQVGSWRSVEDRVRRWDGSWVAVQGGLGPRRDRGEGRRREIALRLLGFRGLGGPLDVRPDNLVGGVEAVRHQLEALGIGAGVVVCGLSQLDEATDHRARGLWEAETLERGYAATSAALEESSERLPTLSQEEAMAEAFLLGGEAVRRIVLDPLLPEPIVDTCKRRALVDSMRRYDALGRHYWKDWAGETVELDQSPGDVSGLAAAHDAITQGARS